MYGGRSYSHSHHHHHHYPNHLHKGAPKTAGVPLSPESALATEIFEQFIAASTFKSVLHYYRYMCDVLRLRPQNIRHFYPKLKSKIHSWKAQALWSKFDKRASHKCYSHGKACTNTKILIIGAGPCGLRSAIEAQLLGAKVVVIEKRDRFSRNNVLHLWPFVIADLKALGAKKFYGKFCAGAIDHISIRQLQCMLLKVALLLGVEVYEGVAFEELLEPPDDQSEMIAWHARFSPLEHPVNQYEFDVLIGADGKRNTLMGFKRKEFRGKLAIAITANFINKHTEQEARVQEISGVAFIFNQKFFKDLYAETGIDLENIVYYKDETHYFVMTAKKHSLIDKGVILRDLPDTQQLLHPNNVDRKALCDYAREAANFSTGYQMPHLDFAVNHYGKPDIAMFDFTSMFAAENACRVVEKKGHKLLQCLVGDSLLEPFWPTGSGCARGFLSSFDACWAVRSWASGKMTPLEVVAERESIYRLLAQTTPENLSKDYSSYTLEPSSRYPTVNLKVLLPFQVRHLHLTDEPDKVDGDPDEGVAEGVEAGEDLPRKRKRRDSLIQPDSLLSWCQKQVAHNADLNVEDLGSSFKDGRVLCTILHRYRPDLIDLENLNPLEHAHNAQLAFDLLEREFGIHPVMTGDELTNADIQGSPDLLGYIAQIHDALRGEIPHSMGSRPPLKVLKGQSLEDLDLGDFPNHPKEKERQYLLTESNLSSSISLSSVQTNGRVSCHILEEPKPKSLSIENLQKKKKRKNESGSLDKLNEGEDATAGPKHKGLSDNSDDFSDRVKELEAKFRGNESVGSRGLSAHNKPKDMIRAVGRLEKSDWNLSAIEKKIEENSKPMNSTGAKKERVPNWSRDSYNDKFQNIERRLRENGEDEDRIAKYLDIDASLKRLERKLREGSTLDTGLRGHNKVSDLALQLSSKLVRKEEGSTSKGNSTSKQARTMVLPTSGSDLCYFCGTRVYLVERLSAEGKFFHRHCFKCSYCGALLRLGNYIYDRENRFGGKFFCIPHFGLTVRSRGPKKTETMNLQKSTERELLADNIFNKGDIKGGLSPFTIPTTETRQITEGEEAKGKAHHLSPPCKGTLPLDRGTTPERVEFENSVIEHSDEDEYLSEDEWTDRNFGASANELDEDDDSDDYSDLSDEVVDEEALLLETSQNKLTADETRRLAESWKRRYSNDVFNITDEDLDESSSESGNEYISEHGAEGDQSHTPTEDEIGDHADDDDDDGDNVRRARELRRLELNINVEAPPGTAETSDSGSETEIGSDSESDTQIDTDSEFADDRELSRFPNEIPTIVIDEMPKDTKDEALDVPMKLLKPTLSPGLHKNTPSSNKEDTKLATELDTKNGAERSASLSNLLQQPNNANPRTEQLRRLLQRTESTEVVSAQRNYLRRQYLLGNPSYSPRKSVSTADLGDRFKSFMDKISETQKKLNPAPQPSPAMQAFLNLSSKSKDSNPSSLSSTRCQPFNSVGDPKEVIPPKPVGPDENRCLIKEEFIKSESGESSDSSSKSEEGKLITFPSIFNSDTISTKKNHLSSSPSDCNNVNNKSHEDSTTPFEEKGTLDSEQSERSNLKKHLENAIGTELCPDKDTVPLIEAFNIPCLDKSKNIVEALNIEIISTENFKNAPTIDSSQTCNPQKEMSVLADDETVEEVFDQLANDALIEFEHSNAASSFNQLDDAFVQRNEKIMNKSNAAETPQNNTILHYEINHPSVLNDKKQDESGFKSLEETRSSLSLETNRVDPVSQNIKKETCEALLHTDQNIVTTPEAVTTEADLSDWGDDNDMFAINADEFDMEFHTGQVPIKNSTQVPSLLPSYSPELARPVRPIARIASLESLGDSDSAISISMSKVPLPSLSHPPSFNDDKIEFVDNSDSDSSQEDPPSVSIRYNQLQDCTPTSPSPPCKELITNSTERCSLDELKDIKCDLTSVKSKSVDMDDTLNQVIPQRSSSEPLSLKEQILKAAHMSSSGSDDSSSSDALKSSSELKYDEITPCFKQRKVPFLMARDSIDVRKESLSKPLFTPSKEDILQRQKNEAERIVNERTPLFPLPIPSGDSSCEAPSQVSSGPRSHRRNSIAKDGDLVREMVMSRISKSNEIKAPRRGSKHTLHCSSSSSLFNSEPTLLLDNSAENKSSSLALNTEESVTPSLRVINHPTVETHSLSSFKLASTENVPSKVAKCENILSPTIPLPNNLSTSLQKITVVNTPSFEKIECSTSKHALPATPLTHPERFQKEDLVKRELFKSSPRLHVTHTSQSVSSTPHLTNPSFLANPQKHIESPRPNDQNVSLCKSLVNNCTKESPSTEQVLKLSANEAKAEFDWKDTLQTSVQKEDTERFPKKCPDERLKELIEERRRKEVSEPRDVRLRKKDSALQECLEEYRQKRSSAPAFTQTTLDFKAKTDSISEARAQLGLAPPRHLHRPSLLELESMHIFSPSRVTRDASPTSFSAATPPLSPNSKDYCPSKSPKSLEKIPSQGSEMKTTKKSKDRERRRSLIQVVAGMFSKSDEKKKENSESEMNSDKLSLPPTPPAKGLPPKSPSVKERFSKLRLSRTKEKKKSFSDLKSRSASVDVPCSVRPPEGNECSSLTNSMPTSPSRTIFSFFSSSPLKPDLKSKGSTTGSSASYFSQRFSPSCIKEEHNSDEETGQLEVSPMKDSPPSTAIPTLRRQKAALRVAKQAEQKRLRMAQEIQRQLEECDVKMRDLEERGVGVEKALIGETEGTARDETELTKEWFCLVHEKNSLVRWQDELTVKARELELEDTHVRLENELRQRMTSAEGEKTREDIEREGKILAEIISIIEQKDALVNLLEEDRQRCAKGFSLSTKFSSRERTNFRPSSFSAPPSPSSSITGRIVAPPRPAMQRLFSLTTPFVDPIALYLKDLVQAPYPPFLTLCPLSSDTLKSYQGACQSFSPVSRKRKPVSVFTKSPSIKLSPDVNHYTTRKTADRGKKIRKQNFFLLNVITQKILLSILFFCTLVLMFWVILFLITEIGIIHKKAAF